MEEPKYTPALNAWYATMLERDKSVLTLAGAGVAGTIAGFIALATSDAIKSPDWMYPGALASVCFVASFWLSLNIFRDNAAYLMKALSCADEASVGLDTASARLRRKKDYATYSLIGGVVFALGMGGVAAIERVSANKQDQLTQLKGHYMANQGQDEWQLMQNLMTCNVDNNFRFNKFEDMHKLPGPTVAKPALSSATAKPATTVTQPQPVVATPAPEEPKAATNSLTSTPAQLVPKQ